MFLRNLIHSSLLWSLLEILSISVKHFLLRIMLIKKLGTKVYNVKIWWSRDILTKKIWEYWYSYQKEVAINVCKNPHDFIKGTPQLLEKSQPLQYTVKVLCFTNTFLTVLKMPGHEESYNYNIFVYICMRDDNVNLDICVCLGAHTCA